MRPGPIAAILPSETAISTGPSPGVATRRTLFTIRFMRALQWLSLIVAHRNGAAILLAAPRLAARAGRANLTAVIWSGDGVDAWVEKRGELLRELMAVFDDLPP